MPSKNFFASIERVDMKKELKFSGYFMTIANEAIMSSLFKENLLDASYNYNYDGQHYTFNFGYDDTLFYIYITHGSPYPLPDVVINTDTQKEEKNPRKNNQYEPKQDFAVIDFKTSYLWLSNTYRKIVLWTFFTEKLKTYQISIKEVYDEDNFISSIKKIDAIRLTGVPSNLFSSSSFLSEELSKELNGYGAASAVIHLKYQNTFVGDSLREKIISLIKGKAALKNIMIAGKDTKNMPMFFNTDAIMRKVFVKTDLNDNGTLNEKAVFDKFKSEISKL